MTERASGDISLTELVAPLIRWRMLIAATALAFGVVGAVLMLLQQPLFTARTTFTPETSGSQGLPGNLAGLAGQLGLGGGAPNNLSPAFFLSLLQSREVREELITGTYPDSGSQGGAGQRTLLDILEIEGDAPRERLQNGVAELGQRLDASVDQPTGIIELEVEMRSPQLAAAVANRAVELLNRFNLERRQTQSGSQRRFTGDRLQVAENELRAAERALTGFLERNRAYAQSPALRAEESRLMRDVQVRQQVFLTLTTAHEEARIAEVRDTPVLTVIDSAVAPFRRSSPRRARGVLVALVAGTAVGIVLAYIAAARARVRSAPDGGRGESLATPSEAYRPVART